MNSSGILMARLPWLFFLITNVVIRVTRLFPGFYCRTAVSAKSKLGVAIEAGPQGWNSIEFKELFISASEYIDAEAVHKVVIDRSASYLGQVECVLKNTSISHYLYDPRTGRQEYWSAIYDSVRVAILMERYRIVPLVYLTDLSLRLPRCQAAVVSAMHGLVINFMLPTKIQQIFPHRRLIGPSLMPFSIRSLEFLERLRSEIAHESINNVVRFTGSLYEPRTTFLRQLSDELAKTGHNLEILGREPGSNRVNDSEYWRRLYTAAIVVTTTDQINQSGADWTWVHQLVFRYLEVLVSGSLLLAPRVSGVSRYFDPDKHFVCYESLADAAEKARYYLDHPEEAEKIRRTGHDKAASLIRSRSFWMLIDTALGFESIAK